MEKTPLFPGHTLWTMKTKKNGEHKRLKSLGIMILLSLAFPAFLSAQDFNPAPGIIQPDAGFVLPSYTASGSTDISGLKVSSPLSTWHKGLGYATVAVGLATGILNPEVAGEGLHQALGITSAGLAAATMGVGFLAHSGDVDFQSGFNSNTVHAFLGIAGGTMMIIAPFLAPGDAHQVLGEAGALTMGLSIVGKLVF